MNEDYIWRFNRYHGATQWILLPKEFISFLNVSEAVFLAHVMDVVGIRLKGGHDREGWVRLTDKDCHRGFGFSPKQVQRHLKKLKAMVIIRVRRVGNQGRRWVFVNIATLETWSRTPDALKSLSRGAIRAFVRRDKTSYLEGTNGRISYTRPPSGDSSNTAPTNHPDGMVEYEKCARALRDSIENVRAINSRSKPNKWFHYFRLLHEKDEIPLPRIQTVLKWYCNKLHKGGDLITNGNPEFIPIAYTGSHFRTKFDSIEAAMSRDQRKRGRDIPKKKTVIRIITDPVRLEELRNDPDTHENDY